MVVEAILDEQMEQHMYGYRDDEALALVSEEHTCVCRANARWLGIQDENEVQISNNNNNKVMSRVFPFQLQNVLMSKFPSLYSSVMETGNMG